LPGYLFDGHGSTHLEQETLMRTLVTLALALAAGGCAELQSTAQEATADGAGLTTRSQDEATPRRIWSGPDVQDAVASPSADGRYLSFTDWSTGNLAVRDLTTGENRVVKDKGDWEVSYAYAEHTVISPDGARIAYTWSPGAEEEVSLPVPSGAGFQLRVIGVDGSGERTLVTGEAVRRVRAAAWTPDSREILAVIQDLDRNHTIARVSPDDGAVQPVKALDWRAPLRVAVSPDGRFLAYDLAPEPDTRGRDISVLDLGTSREQRITQDPKANNRLMGWTADGSGLFFVADQGGSQGVWRASVVDGRRSGSPDLVRGNLWNVRPMGTSRDALFYAVTVKEPELRLAAVDVEAARILTPPTVLRPPVQGRPHGPAWSPDGAFLAYAVQGLDGYDLVIYSADTGEDRTLRPDLGLVQRLAWAPDGRSLYVAGAYQGRNGLYRMDLASGSLAPVVLAGPRDHWVSFPTPTRDGRTLYYTQLRHDGASVLARDLATGAEREVLPQMGVNLSLSPDERYLAAWLHGGHVGVVPVEGGEPRILHEVDGGVAHSVAWAPDGHILFAVRGQESVDLMRSPAEGGDARTLFSMAPDEVFRGIALHPDGRRIAIQSGEFILEVWVLENVE
jgi:Tol biopolymer transport system component